MHKTIASLLLMLASSAAAESPSASTFLLTFDTTSKCTAVAIGKHAFLTAAHCMPATYYKIHANGIELNIKLRVEDKTDHAIFVLNGQEFGAWTHGRTKGPEPGEELSAWGYPGGHVTQQYRRLYGSGVADYSGPVFTLDGNIFFGDSGGGVFDKDGALVCLITDLIVFSKEGVGFSQPGCRPWSFTREQMDEVARATALPPKI